MPHKQSWWNRRFQDAVHGAGETSLILPEGSDRILMQRGLYNLGRLMRFLSVVPGTRSKGGSVQSLRLSHPSARLPSLRLSDLVRGPCDLAIVIC